MECFASNLPFPYFEPENLLVSDNIDAFCNKLQSFCSILLYFLEFVALNSKDQLNSINVALQEIHDLISNVISMIKNGK
jgi:hypothetical protein